MENKNYNNELDELIRASMELKDTPSTELNQQLKVNLYQRESAIRHNAAIRSIPLWFVPMILNFIIFSLFAVFALLVIANPYLAKLTAGICAYIGAAGIVLTVVGIKRTNIKESLTIRIPKRGALYE